MLHSRASGSGADVLLLHGWGMNSEVWSGLADVLAHSYRVTLVDLPGHGHSSFQPQASSLERWAAEVLEIAPPNAVWVGWSLGGSIALQAALNQPDRVKALLMVTATPRFVRGPDWSHAMREDTLSKFHGALVQDPAATLERFLALQVQGGDGARAVLRELRNRLADIPVADVAALNVGLDMLREVDLRDRLAELRMPSLWLFGNRDSLVPWRCAEQLTTLNPLARTIMIPGAAHAPFLSHRSESLALLRGFLEQAA